LRKKISGTDYTHDQNQQEWEPTFV